MKPLALLALVLFGCSVSVSLPDFSDDGFDSWGARCDPSLVIPCGPLIKSGGYCEASRRVCVIPCGSLCEDWGGNCVEGECYR